MKLTALLLLLSGAALAQNENYVAFPYDNQGGSGHWAFFGVVSGGSSDECRAQILIPAQYLPANGGLITAIEAGPHVTGTVTYQRLDLQLGHTTLNPLTSDMNTNLPSPQTVFSATPGSSLAWPSSGVWTRITLSTPFLYQGGMNLVFESRRIVARPATPSGLVVSHYRNQRTDLQNVVLAEGQIGSGASNAQFGGMNAGPAMLVRFIFDSVPTLTVTSSGSGSFFRLGQTATLTVQGNPGEVFADIIDPAFNTTPLLIPPVLGYYYLPSLFNVFFIGVLDGSGLGSLPIGIPNNMLLVGQRVAFQAITAGAAFTWTNAVDVIIRS
jgi:hypothetical protein